MPQQGYPSYLIVGEQSDWDVIDASPIETVYEFINESLVSVSEPITPTRIHRNPSPVKNLLGMKNAAGDIALHLHVNDMLVWIKHTLMDSAVASVDFTAQTVRTDGTFTATESLTTQPTATSPTSDPGKLIFTFAAAQTGTITIAGTDQNDTAISETLTLSSDTTKTTTYYFKSVDASGVTSSLAPGTGNMLIEADKNIYTHTIEIGDTVEAGLTMEIVKGAIPNTYVGCLINTGVLELAETITFTASILAKMANLRENVVGGSTVTDVSGYSSMDEEIFPGWGMALTLDSVQMDIENGSLSFGNNLDYPTRYSASRPRRKPVRQGDREISLTTAVDFDTTNDNFDLIYDSDQVMTATLTGIHKPYAGPESGITITMPRTQLTAPPDPGIETAADLLQALIIRPIRSVGASSSDEVSIEVVSTEASI